MDQLEHLPQKDVDAFSSKKYTWYQLLYSRPGKVLLVPLLEGLLERLKTEV